MTGRILSEGEINQFEVSVNNAYGNSLDTLFMVGNVPMGSPEVMLSIQKKDMQSLFATIRNRNETIEKYERVVEAATSVCFYMSSNIKAVDFDNIYKLKKALDDLKA